METRRIIVNGKLIHWSKTTITYEELVKTAGLQEGPVYSAVYDKGDKENPSGTLSAGQSATVVAGMIFNIRHTGNA